MDLKNGVLKNMVLLPDRAFRLAAVHKISWSVTWKLVFEKAYAGIRENDARGRLYPISEKVLGLFPVFY